LADWNADQLLLDGWALSDVAVVDVGRSSEKNHEEDIAHGRTVLDASTM
jgi:hypothetical protein